MPKHISAPNCRPRMINRTSTPTSRPHWGDWQNPPLVETSLWPAAPGTPNPRHITNDRPGALHQGEVICNKPAPQGSTYEAPTTEPFCMDCLNQLAADINEPAPPADDAPAVRNFLNKAAHHYYADARNI